MKPFLILILILILNPLKAGTTETLNIVGRMPASVDVQLDQQTNLLTARANFPFLMSYRSSEDDESKYVVRVANDGVQRIENFPGNFPFILEIIAP